MSFQPEYQSSYVIPNDNKANQIVEPHINCFKSCQISNCTQCRVIVSKYLLHHLKRDIEPNHMISHSQKTLLASGKSEFLCCDLSWAHTKLLLNNRNCWPIDLPVGYQAHSWYWMTRSSDNWATHQVFWILSSIKLHNEEIFVSKYIIWKEKSNQSTW